MTKLSIIAANGGLFDAYKVFNIATAAAATNSDVTIFFTFEGINLIHKEAVKSLPVSEDKRALLENADDSSLIPVNELVEMAQELGVKFVACQMTLDLMKIDISALVDGVEVGGAVTFLDDAKDANITLTF